MLAHVRVVCGAMEGVRRSCSVVISSFWASMSIAVCMLWAAVLAW